jgi:hypothetical protein
MYNPISAQAAGTIINHANEPANHAYDPLALLQLHAAEKSIVAITR